MEAIEDLEAFAFEGACEALQSGIWDGRHVTWDEYSDCTDQIAQKIIERLASYDPNSLDFQQSLANLARLGADGEVIEFLERDIEQLHLTPDGVIVQAGFGKSISKFWKKYKKEILIGIAVVVVVTTIVVVSTCTGGAGGGAVAAAGGALLGSLDDEPPLPEPDYDWERRVYGRSSIDLPTYAEADLECGWEDFHPAPFQEIPLKGSMEQGTVHYHCGINNNEADILEARDCLYKTLGSQVAVKPHLIHDDSLLNGLLLVQLEKMEPALQLAQETTPSFALPEERNTGLQLYLESSHIQKSIEYEKARLGQIADEIISRKQEDLKQTHVTFSNGGYVFKKALEELTPPQRDTILVITLGSTEIIEDNLACEVYNMIGDKDWPSKVTIGKDVLEKKKVTDSVDVIPQSETNRIIGGHYFLQGDYQEKAKDLINEMKERYVFY